MSLETQMHSAAGHKCDHEPRTHSRTHAITPRTRIPEMQSHWEPEMQSHDERD